MALYSKQRINWKFSSNQFNLRIGQKKKLGTFFFLILFWCFYVHVDEGMYGKRDRDPSIGESMEKFSASSSSQKRTLFFLIYKSFDQILECGSG